METFLDILLVVAVLAIVFMAFASGFGVWVMWKQRHRLYDLKYGDFAEQKNRVTERLRKDTPDA